jgi:hypothetical protein
MFVTPAKAGVQDLKMFDGIDIQLDASLHWKLLLRFQYFRHPWRSRWHDGQGTCSENPPSPVSKTL